MEHCVLMISLTIFTLTGSSSDEFVYPKGLPCMEYNNTYVDCSCRKLTEIPPLRQSNIKTLNLSYNQLQSSSESTNKTTFVHLVSLQQLDLSHNQLETVNGASFIHLTVLQVLDLSHNSLKTVTFDYVLPVQVLDLSYNFISNIQNGSFTGLLHLIGINLGYQDGDHECHGPFDDYSPYASWFIPTLNRWQEEEFVLHEALFDPTISPHRISLPYSGICSLAPSVFYGLHELQVLDLSGNKGMDSLPETVFHGLTNLTHLNLSDNGIFASPPSDLFKDLISLKDLNMRGYAWSQMGRLAETLFMNLVHLTHLDLSVNGISYLPEELFSNTTLLTYLNISFNFLTITPCKAVEGLHMLSTLDMSANYLHFITCPISNHSSLKELSLSDNRNECTPKYWIANSWSIFLSRIPASLATVHLNLCGEYIFRSAKELGPKLNSSLLSLVITVVCRQGLINEFSPPISFENDTFCMFPYLQNLTIQACPERNFNEINLSPLTFQGLLSLKFLKISHFGMYGFPSEELEHLARSLRHLDLSSNCVDSMYYNSSEQNVTFELESLDVSNTNIRYLDLESLGSVARLHMNDLMIGSIEIANNTLNSAVTQLYINSSSVEHTTVRYSANVPLCSLAYTIEEIAFHHLKFLYSAHRLIWGHCLNLKLLIISDSQGNIFDKQLDFRFGNVEKLILTNCNLSSIEGLLESQHLRHIDLRRNRVEKLAGIQFHRMANLTHLDLAFNMLTTIPAGLIRTLPNVQYVGFGNNSFFCVCNIIPLQDWMKREEMTYIDPRSSYFCTPPLSIESKSIVELSLDCSLHLEYYIPPSLTALMLISVVCATVYKYRRHIHYRLWVWFYRRRYQRYVDNDDDDDIMIEDAEHGFNAREAPILHRRYHAYVAYHRESENWVNDELVANIEDGPEQFRLCMKERGDVPAGRYILNAICHGIYHSRKTIAVLSENFMDDGWCHYQLQIAQMRLVKDNEDVLILVQVGEIPDNKKTLLLRQIVRNKGILKWPEDEVRQELFWNQLKMKLRKPIRFDRRFEEV